MLFVDYNTKIWSTVQGVLYAVMNQVTIMGHVLLEDNESNTSIIRVYLKM